MFTPASGNRPNVQISGGTYNNPGPLAGGYTSNHAQFVPDKLIWRQKSLAPVKASKAPNVKGFAVKVQMGTLLDGQKNITMIGVSN